MSGHSNTATTTIAEKLAGFAELCKPRVNSLIVFTAMIGMLLPSHDLPPMKLFLLASLGIGLVACSAAAINCLVERTIDALMARTRARATARGEASAIEKPTDLEGKQIVLDVLAEDSEGEEG